jgi:hypothetical protein
MATFVSPFISEESPGSSTGASPPGRSTLDLGVPTCQARPSPEPPTVLTSDRFHSPSTRSAPWPPERHHLGRTAAMPLPDSATKSRCPPCREHGNGSVALSVSAHSPPRHPDPPRGCDETFAAVVGSHREHAHRLPPGQSFAPSTRGGDVRLLRASTRRRGFARASPLRVLRVVHGLPAGSPFLAPPIEGASASSRTPFVAFSAPSLVSSPDLRACHAGPSDRRLSASRLPSLTTRLDSDPSSHAAGSS